MLHHEKVKFGVAIFPTDYAISMTELAPAAEQMGFESLWVAEHSHIPTSRLSPWPRRGDLPEHYCHPTDPSVPLTEADIAPTTIPCGQGAEHRGAGGALRRRLDAQPRTGDRQDPRAAGTRQSRRPRQNPGDLLPEGERG